MWLVRLFVVGVLLLCSPSFVEDGLYQPTPPWRVMRASWYGSGFEGKLMANGKAFDPEAYTVASYAYKLGRRLLLRCNGVTVTATVTDRGPHVAGRELDVSQSLAEVLGFEDQGLANVGVMPLAD
jgi:rare lipoprotein A